MSLPNERHQKKGVYVVFEQRIKTGQLTIVLMKYLQLSSW